MINTINDEILQEDEKLFLQIRLFRKACNDWGIGPSECADIFDQYNVDEFILDCYEFFHVQGDEANLSDIRDYVTKKGASL